jgi:protease-4
MKSTTKWFLIIASGLVAFGAFATLFTYIILSGFTDRDVEVLKGSSGRIALVELKGDILVSEEVVRQLKRYREDRSIKGIILRVESPGGGVAASQEIYEEVRKTRDGGKPIVVSMGSVAASGGYYVSCGATKIVANPGTVTGSIGVISIFLRWDPLLDKIGIQAQTIKSGRFKDAGSPFREMTKEDRAYFQNLIDNVYGQFVQTVEMERQLEHNTVLQYADGRVYTGTQAREIGLVDTLGTYEDAIALTASLAGIRGTPSIVRERKRRTTLLSQLLGTSKIDEILDLKDQILNQPILQYKMVPGS